MIPVILSIAIAWLLAQCVLKSLIASIKARRFVPEAVWWQGGMPSGHAALVGALCAAIAKAQGFDSVSFAISVVFSALVLYEALVTRNILMHESEVLQSLTKKRVKAVVGHTVNEVIVGLVIGAGLVWYVS